jgi:hypothetical protein
MAIHLPPPRKNPKRKTLPRVGLNHQPLDHPQLELLTVERASQLRHEGLTRIVVIGYAANLVNLLYIANAFYGPRFKRSSTHGWCATLELWSWEIDSRVIFPKVEMTFEFLRELVDEWICHVHVLYVY